MKHHQLEHQLRRLQRYDLLAMLSKHGKRAHKRRSYRLAQMWDNYVTAFPPVHKQAAIDYAMREWINPDGRSVLVMRRK